MGVSSGLVNYSIIRISLPAPTWMHLKFFLYYFYFNSQFISFHSFILTNDCSVALFDCMNKIHVFVQYASKTYRSELKIDLMKKQKKTVCFNQMEIAAIFV